MELIKTGEDLNAFFLNNEFAVIAFYLETDCEGCEDLLPVFEQISEEAGNDRIRFGQMLAQPGSIAENLVKQRQVPFVAIYKNGEMIKCGSVNSEKEFRKMLRRF